MSEDELSESRVESVSANSVTGRENQVGRGSVPIQQTTKRMRTKVSEVLRECPLLRIVAGELFVPFETRRRALPLLFREIKTHIV